MRSNDLPRQLLLPRVAPDSRLQYLARRLHSIERGAGLRESLERYASLDPVFVKLYRGDEFPTRVFVVRR
jgi:hypothetical protein